MELVYPVANDSVFSRRGVGGLVLKDVVASWSVSILVEHNRAPGASCNGDSEEQVWPRSIFMKINTTVRGETLPIHIYAFNRHIGCVFTCTSALEFASCSKEKDDCGPERAALWSVCWAPNERRPKEMDGVQRVKKIHHLCPWAGCRPGARPSDWGPSSPWCCTTCHTEPQQPPLCWLHSLLKQTLYIILTCSAKSFKAMNYSK